LSALIDRLEHASRAVERAIEAARAVVASAGRAPGRGLVHLVPSVGWGGAERLACTLHRLSSARGWRSTLEVPAIESVAHGAWEDAALDAHRTRQLSGAPQTALERSRMLRAWAMATRERVSVLQPSVVHAHLAYPDRFGAAIVASAGRPMVASFQLLPEPGRYFSPDEVFGFRSDTLLRRMGHFLSRVIFVAPSEADAARLRAILPANSPVVRVPNCPPLPRARERSPSPPFEWPEGRARLLSVGRLVEQKGFDRMIDALATDLAKSASWHWLIAGDGPEAERLAERARERGIAERVTIDRSRRAASLYPTADLVLCPSRSEGYPLVPMEAVEAGRPAVVSTIDAHRELFAKCEGAMLPVDEREWPRALCRLIESDPPRRALLAREQQALPSDPRAETGDAYDRLYQKAAHGDRW